MISEGDRRMGWIAGIVLVLDQFTKLLVLNYLDFAREKVIFDGFFKFVHWENTGAAWSLFHNRNKVLAIISLIALLILFIYREQFESKTLGGQIALGLIFGGILGNLLDRLFRKHVIDFVYF